MPTVIVCVVEPVPISMMFCVVDGLVFKALSVMTNQSERGRVDAATGSYSMLTLQLAAGDSENVVVQSAGVPEPATVSKFVPV